MTSLPHRLDRTVVIAAPPAAVFRFFTDTVRWAAWWGAGSSIDPHAGGAVRIRFPDGTEVSGEVIELSPPTRLVFSYGFNSGKPIPPGASQVTIELDPSREGTRLRLWHEFPDAASRDEHVQGWRYHLSLFANVILNELHAGAAGLVDRWFSIYAESDAGARRRTLSDIAGATVRFRDRYSLIEGIDELDAQIAAVQRFMPGVHPARRGDVRHCQGMVIADWSVTLPGDRPPLTGTNVFVLNANGQIDQVTGFWNS